MALSLLHWRGAGMRKSRNTFSGGIKKNSKSVYFTSAHKKKLKMEQNNYNGALQHSIGSGFKATSAAQEVINGIDLNGKLQ